jgi:hypothetical protein
VDEDDILARVPGQYVAQAILSLPDVSSSLCDVMETMIDVPGIGEVTITCRKFRYKRGKTARTFWTAERATLTE